MNSAYEQRRNQHHDDCVPQWLFINKSRNEWHDHHRIDIEIDKPTVPIVVGINAYQVIKQCFDIIV